jgi:hypothetical protein
LRNVEKTREFLQNNGSLINQGFTVTEYRAADDRDDKILEEEKLILRMPEGLLALWTQCKLA